MARHEHEPTLQHPREPLAFPPNHTSSALNSHGLTYVCLHLSGNPFARRETHTPQSITAYKVLTLLTWLLAVLTSVYYTVEEPRDGFTIRRRIWDLNDLYPTGFTLNPIIASVYWYVHHLLPTIVIPY